MSTAPWERDGCEQLVVGDRADQILDQFADEVGCGRKHPEHALLCTRLVDHQGHDHVATANGEVVARWEWTEGDHEGPFTDDITKAREQLLQELAQRVLIGASVEPNWSAMS